MLTTNRITAHLPPTLGEELEYRPRKYIHGYACPCESCECCCTPADMTLHVESYESFQASERFACDDLPERSCELPSGAGPAMAVCVVLGAMFWAVLGYLILRAFD